jgi:hypothetical protein
MASDSVRPITSGTGWRAAGVELEVTLSWGGATAPPVAGGSLGTVVTTASVGEVGVE